MGQIHAGVHIVVIGRRVVVADIVKATVHVVRRIVAGRVHIVIIIIVDG